MEGIHSCIVPRTTFKEWNNELYFTPNKWIIMETADAFKILKKRVDDPRVDEGHRMEILELFHTTISNDRILDIEEYFKELRRLVEYEEWYYI